MHHSQLHQCPELGSGFLCRINSFGHIRNDKQAQSNLAKKKCFNSWSVRNCHKDTSALYTSVASGSITYCPRALLHILAADTNATLFCSSFTILYPPLLHILLPTTNNHSTSSQSIGYIYFRFKAALPLFISFSVCWLFLVLPFDGCF